MPNPIIVTPELLALKLEFEITGDRCLTVITHKNFAGGPTSVWVALPDGVTISLLIQEVS